MALATQCPHCQTTFRVANDQLKLRAGLVRCGACRQVFNGIEHLVRPDHSASADATIQPSPSANPEQPEAAAIAAPISTPIAAEITSVPTEATSTANTALTPGDRGHVAATGQSPSAATEVAPAAHAEPFPSDAAPESAAQKSTAAATTARSPNVWHRPYFNKAVSAGNEDDPLQRMTLFQVAPAGGDGADGADAFATGHADSSEDDELDRLIDELQNKPWRGQKKNAQENTVGSDANVIYGEVRQENEHDTANSGQDAIAEPSFMQQARRKQRVGGVVRTGMWVASLLLLLGLIGQAGYTFRDQLAARVPQLKPMLQSACSKLGCQVGLPMKIDGISIESNELQSIAPARNLFALNLLMRNRSSTVQAWPNIELTLNDVSEKAIVRRVFTPRDYLPAATDATSGFAHDTEQSVKLTFELLQLKASGYRVYLFYP